MKKENEGRDARAARLPRDRHTGGEAVMSRPHPEYKDYCRCDSCNLVKYCIRRDGWNICYSCDNNNFNGLRTRNELK